MNKETVPVASKMRAAAKGVRERLAAHLLLFILIGAVQTGCRNKVTSPSPARFVRIESLFVLHPAWASVVALDQNLAKFQASGFVPTGVALNRQPLPPNFVSPQVVPANLVEARERRLQDDIARYLRYFSQQLVEQNEILFSRFADEQHAALEAQYRSQLNELAHRLEEQRAAQASEVFAQVNQLRLREVALETQIEAYRGQPGADAAQQQKQLDIQIAQLMDRHQKLMASAFPEARITLANAYQKMQSDLNDRLRRKKNELDQEAALAVRTEEGRLRNRPAPILPIGSTATVPFDSRSAPLPLPGKRDVQSLLENAQAQQQSLTAPVRLAWQHQRAELVQQLHADILLAVQEEAKREGWRLVPVNTPGAEDATPLARKFITAQWRQDTIQ